MAAPTFAWNALQEAFYGDQAERLIVVDYEALAKEPERTLRRLYEFLNLSYFKHDFDNVSYEGGGEFDHWLGVPGLHTIGQKVRFQERKPVLPPEIVRRFANQRFWREKGVSKAKVLLPEAELV